MAYLVQESKNFPGFEPHSGSMDHRPMLLKDFLRDDASHSSAVGSKLKKPHIVLLRSWSKTKISAVHKVIKLLQYASMKPPSLALPRSISRKLTKRDNGIFDDVSDVKVKVKDILRWRSFRELAEDESKPLDCQPSPDRSTTTTSCSKSCSWCDTDFTDEEFRWVKNDATLKYPKGDWSFEECEQQSPVSVLDCPFRQVHKFISPTNANKVQRAKCGVTQGRPQPNLEGEITSAAKEKARQLVRHVSDNDDGVIMDFFTRELSTKGKLNDDMFEGEILRIAISWMKGELEESYDWEMEEKRETFVKDMERGICWNKFWEEQEEMCKEFEVGVVFNDLMDDLVTDFLAR